MIFRNNIFCLGRWQHVARIGLWVSVRSWIMVFLIVLFSSSLFSYLQGDHIPFPSWPTVVLSRRLQHGAGRRHSWWLCQGAGGCSLMPAELCLVIGGSCKGSSTPCAHGPGSHMCYRAQIPLRGSQSIIQFVANSSGLSVGLQVEHHCFSINLHKRC